VTSMEAIGGWEMPSPMTSASNLIIFYSAGLV
jgi:hypothetical protein